MNFTEKYQPKNVEQIIGKSQRTIAGNLAKLAHGENIKPIMIIGPYGTGKTSLAKMFVELLKEHSNVEVISINAGDKRGIGEARELGDSFRVGSLFQGYKVYILNEIHKLTADAQDSLLDPLEEENINAKTVIIATTTEEGNLKGMFRSRFSRYYVEKPTYNEMNTLCKWITVREGFEIQDEVKNEIIIKSEGSVRDLVILLQQVATNTYSSTAHIEEKAQNTINLLRSKKLAELLSLETNDYNSLLIGVCTYVIKVLQSNPTDKFSLQILQTFGNGLNQNVPQNIAWAKLVAQYIDKQ